ncbi:MAG: hypothetical protein GC138_02110 [Gammaproteobacteria bacterium]|nr:hypothetical protein [Gammaproteobacteria bacterium]
MKGKATQGLLRPAVCVSAMLLCGGAWGLDLGGNLGYTYRSLTGSTSDDASSHQLRGTLNASGYIWQPWFSNVHGSLNVTSDHENVDRAQSSNATMIATGDLDLSIMPQSRTPFDLNFSASDSRVDVFDVASSVTGLGSREFNTRRLSLKQTYVSEQGNHFQARYDNEHWSSKNGGTLDSELFGLEAELRMNKQKLFAKTSYQTSDRSLLDQGTKTTIINIDHFYTPSRALRVDTMLSHFNSDNNSLLPLNGTNINGNSTTNLSQVSSYVFWRPAQSRLTASGGMRLYNLNTDTVTGHGTDALTLVGNGGLFFQMNRNLRFDGDVQLSMIDNGEQRTNASREKGGALYQSDIHSLPYGFEYQWNTGADLTHQDTEYEKLTNLSLRAAHDAQRLWAHQDGGATRLSLSQALSSTQGFGDISTSTQRLDHSASVSWDRTHSGGTTYLQATLSDARTFGDGANNQQFLNLQAQRHQDLTRKSSLSGNLTVQATYQDFNGRSNNDTVTATGQVSYRHDDLFDVPRLRFLSDLRTSRAAVDTGIDRTEWENRLDYDIGMLNVSGSWRWVSVNDERFNLIDLQADRRF